MACLEFREGFHEDRDEGVDIYSGLLGRADLVEAARAVGESNADRLVNCGRTMVSGVVGAREARERHALKIILASLVHL